MLTKPVNDETMMKTPAAVDNIVVSLVGVSRFRSKRNMRRNDIIASMEPSINVPPPKNTQLRNNGPPHQIQATTPTASPIGLKRKAQTSMPMSKRNSTTHSQKVPSEGV